MESAECGEGGDAPMAGGLAVALAAALHNRARRIQDASSDEEEDTEDDEEDEWDDAD